MVGDEDDDDEDEDTEGGSDTELEEAEEEEEGKEHEEKEAGEGEGRGKEDGEGEGRQPEDYLLYRNGSNPTPSQGLRERQKAAGRLDRLVGWEMRMPGQVQVEKVRWGRQPP